MPDHKENSDPIKDRELETIWMILNILKSHNWDERTRIVSYLKDRICQSELKQTSERVPFNPLSLLTALATPANKPSNSTDGKSVKS